MGVLILKPAVWLLVSAFVAITLIALATELFVHLSDAHTVSEFYRLPFKRGRVDRNIYMVTSAWAVETASIYAASEWVCRGSGVRRWVRGSAAAVILAGVTMMSMMAVVWAGFN